VKVKRTPIPLCTDATGRIQTLRSSREGGELSSVEARALLEDVRGNPGSTARLTIVARTYLQTDKPNRNFVRFRDGALRAVATSFEGAPFLRDHNQGELLARGGTIVASKLVEDDDGTKAFEQTIELTKPWAIEAALDGTLDRFSIGWRAVGEVTCTVCHKAFEAGWFGLSPACEHELGEEYEVRGGAKRIAQAEFSGAEGVEVSGVSVPAVTGTSIDAIRAALAAGELSDLLPYKEPQTMLVNISQALKLAATADEPAVLREIERRDMLLEAERARAESAETRAAAAEARLSVVEEQRLAARRAELLALALREGKATPTGPIYAKLAKVAERDVEAAEALLAEMPRVTPVGKGLASAEPAPKDSDADLLSDSDREVCKVMGLSAEQFLASRKRLANGRG
jgi:hypothetical protein